MSCVCVCRTVGRNTYTQKFVYAFFVLAFLEFIFGCLYRSSKISSSSSSSNLIHKFFQFNFFVIISSSSLNNLLPCLQTFISQSFVFRSLLNLFKKHMHTRWHVALGSAQFDLSLKITLIFKSRSNIFHFHTHTHTHAHLPVSCLMNTLSSFHTHTHTLLNVIQSDFSRFD